MLTKPNILRLVCFVVCFAGALYYPVREVLYYKCEKPEREFRYRVSGASLNDFDIRPKVSESGRWKWVDYIFPRIEADKLRLDLLPSEDPDAPKRLTFVYYPMSRQYAKDVQDRINGGKVKAELVIERYPSKRLHIGKLLIDGMPVSEQKVGGK